MLELLCELLKYILGLLHLLKIKSLYKLLRVNITMENFQHNK